MITVAEEAIFKECLPKNKFKDNLKIHIDLFK